MEIPKIWSETSTSLDMYFCPMTVCKMTQCRLIGQCPAVGFLGVVRVGGFKL